MKGICLAGGVGRRMMPLTSIDNKHLLPLFNKRMIEQPISTLTEAGIDEIILITGGQRAGSFLELFGNGRRFGINKLFYTYQDGSGGIADALKLAEPFIRPDEDCVVILGDNYFEDGLTKQIREWENDNKSNAGIIVQETDKPWNFGIAERDDTGRIISIEEKPERPRSNLAVLGAYFFPSDVWNFVKQVQPSTRGELEITDLLKFYIEQDRLTIFEYNGFWSDMGSFESWATVFERTRRNSQ